MADRLSPSIEVWRRYFPQLFGPRFEAALADIHAFLFDARVATLEDVQRGVFRRRGVPAKAVAVLLGELVERGLVESRDCRIWDGSNVRVYLPTATTPA